MPYLINQSTLLEKNNGYPLYPPAKLSKKHNLGFRDEKTLILKEVSKLQAD